MHPHSYDLALARAHGIGPRTYHRLLQHFGSSQAVFQLDGAELRAWGLRPTTVEQLLSPELLDVADMELSLGAQHHIRHIFYWQEEFPSQLRLSAHCPICICVQGNLHPHATAVVGTRRPSPAGLLRCETISSTLRDRGGSLVSGLAFGIDRKAHQSSLDLDIPNMAVLGQGLLPPLDQQGQALAQRILDQGGALISQFSLWSPAERHNFPLRNGIIAGLCRELILVESKASGGGMITARMCAKQNRPTYAWMDRSELCAGGQVLAQQNLALDLNIWLGTESAPKPKLSAQEQQALHTLSKPKNLQEICLELQCETAQVLTLLSMLELKGLVQSTAGAHYQALNPL